MFYVYGLKDPDTNEIVYIGQTNNIKRRYWQHTNPSFASKSPTKKDKWVTSILLQNKKPLIVVLEEVETKLLADEKEIFWVSHFGRKNLLNQTDGGNNFSPKFSYSLADTNIDRAKQIISRHLKIIMGDCKKRSDFCWEYYARQYGVSWEEFSQKDILGTKEWQDAVNLCDYENKKIIKRFNHEVSFDLFSDDEILEMSRQLKTRKDICFFLFDLCEEKQISKLKSLIFFDNNKDVKKFIFFVTNNPYWGDRTLSIPRRYDTHFYIDGEDDENYDENKPSSWDWSK